MTPEERRAAVRKHVGTKAEDFGAADLQAIADGPIMDSNGIYLPAGRLSQAEYEARLREQFREAGIEGSGE